MPLSRKNKAVSKHVTLKEALNWVAFGNFDGSDLTPVELDASGAGPDNQVETIQQNERNWHLFAGADDLFAALRDGDVEGYGFLGTQYEYDCPWTGRHYENHHDTRGAIPADFWRREGVNWGESLAKGTNGEYVEIVLLRRAVLGSVLT